MYDERCIMYKDDDGFGGRAVYVAEVAVTLAHKTWHSCIYGLRIYYPT